MGIGEIAWPEAVAGSHFMCSGFKKHEIADNIPYKAQNLCHLAPILICFKRLILPHSNSFIACHAKTPCTPRLPSRSSKA